MLLFAPILVPIGLVVGLVLGRRGEVMRRFQNVDYYAVLGVPSSASRDEIKAAYRTAVRSAHPDAGGDHDTFALVSEAWEVLGDENARGHYDADRRMAARANRPYTTRLRREEDPGDGADPSGGDQGDARRQGDASARSAREADGVSDAERWRRNKRRF